MNDLIVQPSNFCHIAPTSLLNLTANRSIYLVLAHLVECDEKYTEFFVEQKKKNRCTIIMDNSAYEMYKQGKPMYPTEKLITMAEKVNADYIVMTDYPGEQSDKTIAAAQRLAPIYHDLGYKTFFVPQGNKGDVFDTLKAYDWAVKNPEIVDYIGVSILAAPLALCSDMTNRMQRFVSRLNLMYLLHDQYILDAAHHNKQKIHLLGMLDGPNEVMYMRPFAKYITSWDSSAAIWAAVNGIAFDGTPTGLKDGKIDLEVDFNFKLESMNVDTIEKMLKVAETNIQRIDSLWWQNIAQA